jgi:predicted amidohydrolase
LKIACCQMRSGRVPSDNLAVMERAIEQAAKAGADYLQFPEMSLILDKDRESLRRTLSGFDREACLEQISQWARKAGLAVHCGSFPVSEGENRFYNRSYLFAREGDIIAHYDKIHLFDVRVSDTESYRESAHYQGGNRAVLAPVGQALLGLTICYDLRFPALYRTLAQAGAHILCVPAAFTVPTGRAHWHTLLRARAIENNAFVMASAQGGAHEDGRLTYGHSMIINPDGHIMAELDHDEEGLLFADIDLEDVRRKRTMLPSLSHDRPFSLTQAQL